MGNLTEENVGSLAVGVADNLVELGAQPNSTLNILGRGHSFSAAFSIAIGVRKVASSSGDGFDYTFTLGGEVIGFAANVALASSLEPVLLLALRSAPFLASVPPGAALIGAGLIAGGVVIFATSLLVETAEVIADLSIPDTTITVIDNLDNEVIQYVVNGPISATGFADESEFIRGYISSLDAGAAVDLEGLTFEFTRPLEDPRIFTIENGDIIVEIAEALTGSVDSFLVASESAIDHKPFTAFFTDGISGQNDVLFETVGEKNYIFVGPNDKLSIDIDGKFFTPRIEFSPSDFIEGSGDVFGNAANNIILGSDGADILSGAGGADLLLAGAGKDYLHGGAGDDSLFGGADADRFVASAGNDFVGDYNFAEGDILQFNNITEIDGLSFGKVSDDLTITIDGGLGFILDGALTGAIGSGSQTIDLRLDLDGKLFEVSLNYDLSIASVKQLATDGDDVLTGSDDPDQPDEMDGLAGDDILNARDGNDMLTGGLDNDILTGGAGRDSFVLTGGDGDDIITDYTLSEADFLHLTDVADEDDLSTRRVAADGSAAEDGTDLEVTYGGGDSIQLNDFYDTQDGPVRTVLVQFANEETPRPVHINEDGSILDASALDDIVPESGNPSGAEILGTPEIDLLEGAADDEVMIGFEGGRFICSDSRFLNLGANI